MKRFCSIFVFILCMSIVNAQDTDRKINFPDIQGYLTLKVDLHTHSVFSDGSVWPNIRVDEAVKDGLNAMAITEHLEYQPHKEDLPHPDRNRSFELAKKAALPHDLLIIPGAEITRKMPPGHNNAIFIQDANKLLGLDSVAVFEEANAQGAFVFWNHPDWIQQKSDGIAELTDMHKMLISRNLLHGIEVVNDLTYSEEALEIAKITDISAIGTSDIHGLVDWSYNIANGGHRPITLVFAEEKSLESIKEALFQGRTVAWFDHLLVGKKQWVQKLVEASLKIEALGYVGPSSVLRVKISNSSDCAIQLNNQSEFGFQNTADLIILPPQSETIINIKTLENLDSITLDFEVLNAIVGRGEKLKLSLRTNW